MKTDIWILIQATVICALVVAVVAPGENSNKDAHNSGSPSAQATGEAQPPAANIRDGEGQAVGAGGPGSHGRPNTGGSLNIDCTGVNNTNCDNSTNGNYTSFADMISKNKGMLERAVYVLIGVTVVILLYFGLRTWSTRRRKSKTKKYGVITTPANDMEMTPLDQEDDDEDMTVFEVNGLHK